MLSAFDPSRGALVSVEPDAEITARWVHSEDPTPRELAQLHTLGADPEDLEHALDPHEVARVAVDGSRTLVILRVAWVSDGTDDLPFRSTTVGLVVTHDGRVLSVARRGSALFSDAAARKPDVTRPWSLVLSLVELAAAGFLHHLREIERKVEQLEDELQSSLRNREVLELLRHQKSLVHFTKSLASLEIMLERLPRQVDVALTEDERQRRDDVLVEVRQAREMCAIAEDILSQMMDAFASIISNNLNVVMKVLTAATVLLAVPTLLASFYGMNVQLPGQHHPWAFVTVFVSSMMLVVTLTLALKRLRWL